MSRFREHYRRAFKSATTPFRGRCEIGTIEKSLGRSPGYLAYMADHGSKAWERVLATVEALDESSESFQSRLAGPDVEGLLESLLPARGPFKQTPENTWRESSELRELREATYRAGQAQRANQQTNAPGPPSEEELRTCLSKGSIEVRCQVLVDPAFGCHSIEGVRRAARVLDDRRYSQPWDAAALSHALAVRVAANLPGREGLAAFCHAAGSFASAHRLAGSLDTAARSLLYSAPLAAKVGDLEWADLLQRAGAVLSDHARYEDALKVCNTSGGIYFCNDEMTSLGKTLAHKASYFSNSGKDPRIVLTCYRHALGLIPAAESRSQAACMIGIAHSHLGLGEAEAALQSVREAQELAHETDSYSHALIWWLLARIHLQSNATSDALTYLEHSRELLGSLNPFDLGLVTLDLIDVLLGEGRIAEATQYARSLKVLLEPLQGNRIVSSAIAALHRKSATNELSRSLVAAIRKRLEGGRRQGINPPPIQSTIQPVG